MKQVKLKKGLKLPVSGEPEKVISDGMQVKQLAVLGEDYIGLKPKFAVEVGDAVAKGQLLFTDKKMPGIKFTSPGAGKVAAINRGEKRKFLSIVIFLTGEKEISFKAYNAKQISTISGEDVRNQLIESGLWTAIRSRPFGKVADPDAKPSSIFITAMDTNPLAPDIELILKERVEDFKTGAKLVSALTDGKLFICKSPGTDIPAVDSPKAEVVEFSGKHPAGNVGTHVHFLDPVHTEKHVWHISAQDVCAMGALFLTGKLNNERVVSLAGPSVKEPRLITVSLGSSLLDITSGELADIENRIISGSLLSGRKAEKDVAFLGRYHQQVSVIAEFPDSGFFAWTSLGVNKYSVKNVFFSSLLFKKLFNFSTAAYGGLRAIVPIESYEKVVPLDIIPNYLLRALAVDDIEEAINLGCLELEEEDLALCTFVCPSKIDHGANLRRTLNIIEKEG